MPVLFVGEFAKLRRAGTLRYAWHASRLRDAGVSAFLHMFAFWHFPDLERSPTCVRKGRAGSSGRCNTSIKSFGWGCKSQSLAWSFVELPSHFVELGLRVHGQVSPLRQVLPKQTVGVFIGTTLPRTLRIAEVNVDVGRQRQAPMLRKLLAAVPGQRLIQLIRYRLRLLDQRGNYGLSILLATFVSVT